MCHSFYVFELHKPKKTETIIETTTEAPPFLMVLTKKTATYFIGIPNTCFIKKIASSRFYFHARYFFFQVTIIYALVLEMEQAKFVYRNCVRALYFFGREFEAVDSIVGLCNIHYPLDMKKLKKCTIRFFNAFNSFVFLNIFE